MPYVVECDREEEEPVCWRGDLIELHRLRLQLTEAEVASLLGRSGATADLGNLAQRIIDTLENGDGMCVVAGLDDHCKTEAEYEAASMVLGRAIGMPVAQNLAGDKLVQVKDTGGSTLNPTQRGHQTKDALGFHNDRCDIILLTCIHQAEQGGDSYVVSAKYAHDIIADQAPHHLKALYGDFPNHRRGEEAPGEAPWCAMPVFSWVDGKFVCRYVKRFITDSQLIPEAPRLTTSQLAALDFMDDLINTPGVHLKFKLKRGDMFLVNNHVILHGRSAYVDSGPHKRALARVWLAHKESRALPESFLPIYRDVSAGTLRGGI